MSDAKAELVRLQNATRDARTALMHQAIDPEKLTRDILKPGRLVRVRDGDDEWGWGAVVGVRDLPAEAVPPLEPDKASEWGLESEWAKREMRNRRRAIDVLIHCGPGVDEGVLRPAKRILGRPGKLAEKGCTCEIIPVALRLVDAVGAMVLTLPRDLTDASARAGWQRQRAASQVPGQRLGARPGERPSPRRRRVSRVHGALVAVRV